MTDAEFIPQELQKLLQQALGSDQVDPLVLNALVSAIEDARRWRALMATARMRPMGSAGLNIDGTRNTEDTGWVHFGMELWSTYAVQPGLEEAARQNNTWAQNALTAMTDETLKGVDAAAGERARQEDVRQRLFDAAVILGADVRYVLVNLEAYGLNDACEMAPSSHGHTLDPDRTHRYLLMKHLIDDQCVLTEKGKTLRDFITANTLELEPYA
ncbi:hypothetical protein GURKE_00920 [Brevundimonas phage vB_BpoS-Gurke]|uniref:Uncharacterized protein n=1 Tax=Brevundimonas phage vB_BpoS-Gurke TaxID=2948599 RepID=A0A9E7N3E6_9CAUD|nr:hypothetical protein GURKE_00920 [Brevundimonas phage vB_BpoS-Gurke]